MGTLWRGACKGGRGVHVLSDFRLSEERTGRGEELRERWWPKCVGRDSCLPACQRERGRLPPLVVQPLLRHACCRDFKFEFKGWKVCPCWLSICQGRISHPTLTCGLTLPGMAAFLLRGPFNLHTSCASTLPYSLSQPCPNVFLWQHSLPVEFISVSWAA